MQMLALDGAHAVAEPKRLRLHLCIIAGRLVRTARQRIDDRARPRTASGVINPRQRQSPTTS
jgi:hypothetical protein